MLVREMMRFVEQNLTLNDRASVTTYPSQVKPLLRALGNCDAEQIQFLDLEKYKADRKKAGLANATINHELAVTEMGCHERTMEVGPDFQVTSKVNNYIPDAMEVRRQRLFDACMRSHGYSR